MPNTDDATRVLSDAQVEQFIRDGFAKIEGAFPRDVADEGRAILWRDTGCDPNDLTTWTKPVIRLGLYGQEPFAKAANTAILHKAFDQLVGRGHWLPGVNLGTFPRRQEVLATGDAGAVYLCHPFLAHAAQPHRGTRPRFLAQPPLLPADPLVLKRADGNYSPVEQAIENALRDAT